MSVPVFTAVTDAGWEADLVAGLHSAEHGVTVVRRCVDVADLLAAASSGTARAAVLSADLRRLDGEVLSRLRTARVAVVGLVESGEGEERLRRLGVRHVLPADSSATTVADAVLRAVADPYTEPGTGLADPRGALPDLPVPRPPADDEAPGRGRLVAVWGPSGGPGRTTVAIGVADEAARLGVPTVLVDADVYGGSVAQVLGLLDEAPGLAAAARLETQGRLDVRGLAAQARGLGPRLRVLTGISRADRWPELRPDAVRGVLRRLRSLAALTVVDCGFCLEQDEELSYDTMAPRRNGATVAVLEEADEVLVVGSADPVGVQRLVRGLTELGELGTVPPVRVVVNRLREVVVPGNPRREVAAALQRFAGVEEVAFLPYDRAGLDRALAVARTLGEVVAGSPLRTALVQLASEVTGVRPPVGAHRGRRAG